MINIKKLTSLAKEASLAAGKAILEIYNSADFGVEIKGDNSPLTKADQAAHQVIVKYLEETGLPILSEEGKDIPYKVRKDWEYFWMVDPLDGTKEFIKKNGEFTVNIALIHQGKPIMGVVYAPVLEWLYWGNQEEGAWKQEGNENPIQLKKQEDTEVKTIVASRSHLSPETQEFIDQYPGVEVISMGSSLKFMLIAEGKSQIYPRFAPTMEWDTAAAQGVILANKGMVLQFPSKIELGYNKENLLNPWFIVYN
ncbi:3'(2'),5'-bisphosphate nucleotidase CysQ [Algoriphagus zhangzhouensis]|uniref:3'(2'),5'-bisphosphate nucleotidase CysQ n=1 Tax=Algoriphagus zhangzhouensis TaxID=1073327 RepID=A0A1M7Z372_9BACT|nr:3'(2'),5'-bisphosphate nucleotidase CysQ [Algoriphagus zhangzhouensis]TDY48362.1 3'(2'),5'-bisphosphate nucleotidase [Algoriphagus zhangzhouensis]SHO59409.1 3'(2'), 5'-bisphosphate nucleotidase [Algoriphagus zhangzhouensis]